MGSFASLLGPSDQPRYVSGGGGGSSTYGIQQLTPQQMGYGTPLPGGTSSTTTGGGMPTPPPPTAPKPLNITASDDPRMTGLLDQANAYMEDLRKGTGEVEETTAQKIRDAREGGRTALREGMTGRGVASSNALAGYDAETQRGENAAIAGVAQDRRAAIGGALANAANIAGGIGQRALAEKAFALSAWSAENAAQQQQYAQWLALLNASRQTPINNVETSPPIAYA